MKMGSLIKKLLLYLLFMFWIIILVAELLVWGNLRLLFLPQVAVVEMVASLLQDTLWIPAGLAMPLYLLWFFFPESSRWLVRVLAVLATLLVLVWAINDVLFFFRILFIVLFLLIIATIRNVRRTRQMHANVFAYLAVCAGLFLNYGPQMFPSVNIFRSTTAGQLKILDYNISMSQKGEQRTAVFNLIEKEDPDIVFIQEISSSDRKLFLRRFGDRYPHQLWADRFENYNGGAILSKKSFKNSRNIDIATPFMPGHTNVNHAVITVQGRDVHLFNCHLYPAGHAFIQLIFGKRSLEGFVAHTRTAYLRRSAEAEQLQQIVAQVKSPVILAGDFNDTPNSPVYQRFTSFMQNAFATAGWGLGTTYGHFSMKGSVSKHWKFLLFDFLRIDQVFTSTHFRILEARVIPLDASDHRPQIVRVAL